MSKKSGEWLEWPRNSPASNEVYVFKMPLDGLDRLDEFLNMLNAEERTQAASFAFQDDSRRYIVSHGLTRMILGICLEIPPHCLRFAIGEFGKPRIETPERPELFFNMSHSHELSLLALSRSCDVGIDIQRARPMKDILQLARDNFAAEEYRAIVGLSPAEQTPVFFSTRARKEAFIKATGRGMHEELDSFCVTVLPTETPAFQYVQRSVESATGWNLVDLLPENGYAGALVYHGTKRNVIRFAFPSSPDSTL